jgi:hypothetical protein
LAQHHDGKPWETPETRPARAAPSPGLPEQVENRPEQQNVRKGADSEWLSQHKVLVVALANNNLEDKQRRALAHGVRAVTEQKTDISPAGRGKPKPLAATLSSIPSQIISHNANVLRLGFATRKPWGILRQCCRCTTSNFCDTSRFDFRYVGFLFHYWRYPAHKEHSGDASGAARLTRVSPVAWQHINLYGRYEFRNAPATIDL